MLLDSADCMKRRVFSPSPNVFSENLDDIFTQFNAVGSCIDCWSVFTGGVAKLYSGRFSQSYTFIVTLNMRPVWNMGHADRQMQGPRGDK